MTDTVLVVITQNKDESLRAVKKAISVSKEVHLSKLRLLYMYPIFSSKKKQSFPILFQEQLIQESEESFKEVVQLIEKEKLPYEKYIGIGNLIHEIRIQIQQGRCQTLIISPGQLNELMEGPIDLIENLTCPVLLA